MHNNPLIRLLIETIIISLVLIFFVPILEILNLVSLNSVSIKGLGTRIISCSLLIAVFHLYLKLD